MIAAILEKLNASLAIRELEVPPLKIGQVLVDVHYSAICGAQLGEISGAKGPDKYLPHCLGHEGSGIVKAVGTGVRNIKVGDHVVMHWRKGLGIEAEPAGYAFKVEPIDGFVHYKRVGGGPVHTFCTEAVVSENRLTPIPENFPLDIACLYGCAITTGFGLIENEAMLELGESVAVAGCGGVGLSTIMGAAVAGAGEILAFDIHDAKLGRARMCGATQVWNVALEETDMEDAMRAYEVDVFIDCTGSEEIIQSGFDALGKNGRMILVGQPHHDRPISIKMGHHDYRGRTIMDSQGGLTVPYAAIPRYIAMYECGQYTPGLLVSHTYGLGDVDKAIFTARGPNAGKVLLDCRVNDKEKDGMQRNHRG